MLLINKLLFTVAVVLVPCKSACGACFSTTSDILNELATLPDPSPHNITTIELCPSNVFSIGYRTLHGDWVNGQPPLMARSHTHYRCGPEGYSNSSCVLTGGQVQFWSPRPAYKDNRRASVMNVVVKGITFEAAGEVAILLEHSGDVKFIDCLVQNHNNSAPVVLKHSDFNLRRSLAKSNTEEYSSSSAPKHGLLSSQGGSRGNLVPRRTTVGNRALLPHRYRNPKLTVLFEGTQFIGNRQDSQSQLFTYGIITAFYLFHDVTIENCVFENNEYRNNERGYLIRTYGTILAVKNSWFLNNKVSGWGLVEIMAWDWANGPLIGNNDGIVSQSDTGLCPFAALSETIPELAQHVQCIDLDGSEFVAQVSPTAAPSQQNTPTVGLPAQSLRCFASTRNIVEFFSNLPSVFPITIELCPFTVYPIGRLLASGEWVDGDPALPARSLTTYKCGTDGVVSNNCVLVNGDVQFWSTASSTPFTGVEVRGITFENATGHGALIEGSGDFKFVDCVFQKHKEVIPVLSTNSSQIEFIGSIFRDNQQIAQSSALTYGIITISTTSQDLTIKGCSFYNNSYENDEGGYLVKSLGSTVVIKDSLFFENIVSGWGLVEIFDWKRPNDPLVLNNDGNVSDNDTRLCPFLAVSETIPTTRRDIQCIGLNETSVPPYPANTVTAVQASPKIASAGIGMIAILVFAIAAFVAVLLMGILTKRQNQRKTLDDEEMFIEIT